MPNRDQYSAGWFDSSVQEFVKVLPRRARSARFALITALDSATDLRPLTDKGPLKNAQMVGNGIMMPTASLIDNASSLFFGFDEIWFFPNERIPQKPEWLTIVGPKRIDGPLLSECVQWMSQNRCSLALGDGVGLNLIIKARGWMVSLLALSLQQRFPQPTIHMQPDGELVVFAD